MNIETRFSVNDLVQRKFDTSVKEVTYLLEIMELMIQVCYSTTQVFYLCRPIMLKKEKEGYGKEDFHWVIYHGTGEEYNATGWKKYREDELINANSDIAHIVLTTNKEYIK